MKRHAIARFYQSVNAIRLRLRECESDLSDRVCWKSVAFEFGPRRSAIVRNEKTAAGTATFPRPRVHLELPHCGEQCLRIRRMHHDIDAAGVRIDEQHSHPRFPTVCRAIDPTLLLRTVAVSLSSDEDDVRILRIDCEASDSATLLESHSRPCAS